jgi:hypothetical protein
MKIWKKKTIGYEKFRKIISLIVIAAFVLYFQNDIFLISQKGDELSSQFDKAKSAYINAQYDVSRNRLNRLIEIIKEQEPNRRDILGKSYLLLGAIDEKEQKIKSAKENYQKALKFNIHSIEGLDLNDLKEYKRVVEGEIGISKIFENAVIEYNKPEYNNSRTMLEMIIGTIIEGELPRPDILGKSYLLLGANYEKIGQINPAKENYQEAIDNYEIGLIEGVDLNDLNIYKEVINKKFEKARDGYNNKQYTNLKDTLKKIIRIITKSDLDMKDTLGKCFILLGAIDEKEGKIDAAKENYQKAIVEHNVETIDEVEDLNVLPIYKKSLKEGIFEKARQYYLKGKEKEDGDEFESAKGFLIRLERELDAIKDKELLGKVCILLGATHEKLAGEKIDQIEKASLKRYYKKAKKLFPPKTRKVFFKDGRVIGKEKCNPIKSVDLTDLEYFKKYYCKKKRVSPLLVVVAVAGAVGLVLLVKGLLKKREYTLTVRLEEGVEGNPANGIYKHKKGERVTYSYREMSGYSNLRVLLDGTEVDSSGTITMDQNHTLTASATPNVVVFITDQDTIQIPEGGTASFNVRLSAQPTADVNVTVTRESGDTDISVITGASLTFTTSNWNIDQAVTLQAAQDADTTNGQAVIAITAPGITLDKNITVTEQDDDEEMVTVSIVKPKNGAEVTRGDKLDIIAEAYSANGIEKVEFFVDNEPIGTDRKAPYKAVWDTTGEWEGSHTVRVVAYDNIGNNTEDKITVTVMPQ